MRYSYDEVLIYYFSFTNLEYIWKWNQNFYLISSLQTLPHYRQFLRGLHVYGRGNWKNISRHFVTTKTPVQVSSHAQKYFLRKENGTKKQRYSINDIGLYDFEPFLETNASVRKGPTFGGGVYNTNHYSFGGHPTSMNNAQAWSPFLCHTGHGSRSSSQAATLAISQNKSRWELVVL